MKPDTEFLKPQIEKIPAELKKPKQWVCWKAENRDGKQTKIPYDPKTHRKASATNPETWAPFWQAVKESKSNGYAGIGFVVSKDDDFCGWDFDHCIDEHGGINSEAQPVAAKLNSYTEYSPSGKGLRVIAKGKLPKTGRKKGGFEVYDTGRYFTITGHPVNNSPTEIREAQPEITAVHKQIFGRRKKQKFTNVKNKSNDAIKTDTSKSDADISRQLVKAFASKNGDRIKALYDGDTTGYLSQSEADMALCSHLAFWFKNDIDTIDLAFRKSGLMRDKWDSKRGDTTYGQITIEKAQEREAIQAEPVYKRNEKKKAVTPATKQIIEPLPDPQDDHRPAVFPAGVMSGPAGQFTGIYGSHLEPPEQFFYMSYLTLLGMAVCHKLTLSSQRRYRPNYYTVLLGESGKTRKSTAIEETVRFFTNALSEKHFTVCRGAASGEALGKKFEENLNVLLYYDELKVFVNKANIQNSTLLSAVNILFETTRYENFKTKDPLIINDAHLSVLAASTVDTYAEMFSPKYLDIGFNNRLFLVPGDSDKCIPVPMQIPDDEINFMKKELGACLKLIDKNPVFALDPIATERWERYYRRLREISDPYVTRLDTYGLRLMPLLAANDMKTTIDADTVDKVIKLLDWQYHVRKAHDPIDAEGDIPKMEQRLRRCWAKDPQAVFKKWQLQPLVNYKRYGIRVFEWALNNLVENGEVYHDTKQKTYILANKDHSGER